MKCSPKTMLKIGIAIVAVLAAGYFFFPQSRSFIIGLAPIALFATCPIAMWFATRGMDKGQHNHAGCASCEHEKPHARDKQIVN